MPPAWAFSAHVLAKPYQVSLIAVSRTQRRKCTALIRAEYGVRQVNPHGQLIFVPALQPVPEGAAAGEAQAPLSATMSALLGRQLTGQLLLGVYRTLGRGCRPSAWT